MECAMDRHHSIFRLTRLVTPSFPPRKSSRGPQAFAPGRWRDVRRRVPEGVARMAEGDHLPASLVALRNSRTSLSCRDRFGSSQLDRAIDRCRHGDVGQGRRRHRQKRVPSTTPRSPVLVALDVKTRLAVQKLRSISGLVFMRKSSPRQKCRRRGRAPPWRVDSCRWVLVFIVFPEGRGINVAFSILKPRS